METKRFYSSRPGHSTRESTEQLLPSFATSGGRGRGRGRGFHNGPDPGDPSGMGGNPRYSSFAHPSPGNHMKRPAVTKRPPAMYPYYRAPAPLPAPPPAGPPLRRPSNAIAARRVPLPRPHIVAPPPPRRVIPRDSHAPPGSRHAPVETGYRWGPVAYSKTSASGGTTRYGISGQTFVKKRSNSKSLQKEALMKQVGDDREKAKRVYTPTQQFKRRKQLTERILWSKLLYENYFFMQWTNNKSRDDSTETSSVKPSDEN